MEGFGGMPGQGQCADAEVLRQQAVAEQAKQRREQVALGQITCGTEQEEGVVHRSSFRSGGHRCQSLHGWVRGTSAQLPVRGSSGGFPGAPEDRSNRNHYLGGTFVQSPTQIGAHRSSDSAT
ncbi:hypothetical protein G6F50_015051 [Rhizopus delemar]|uniref:Uncharacterized protein n=1 Tax=Rhizopus delemar TaxID=936053 RepID=A0A9P6Y1B1_9FUNG|nr:hypothetical protein G6F50_015051 [Rhizopus delemar]